MMVRMLLLLLAVLLAACSNQENQAITKHEETSADSGTDPSFIEKTGGNENTVETDFYLEFPLNEEVISINTSKISILNSYLQASEDKEKELTGMQLRSLFNLEDRSIYLLQFACRNSACSYLLLSQGEESFSYLAADAARFKLSKISPDQTKILLIFSRDFLYNNSQLVQDKLMIMDINEWKEVPFKETNTAVENFDFTWPILRADWVDESNIKLTIPSAGSPEQASLYNWSNSDRKTRNIEVQVLPEAD